MFALSTRQTNWKRLDKVMIIWLSGNLMPSGCVAFCFHSFSHTECLMRMNDDGIASAATHSYYKPIHISRFMRERVRCRMMMMIWRQTRNVRYMFGYYVGWNRVEVDGARCCSKQQMCLPSPLYNGIRGRTEFAANNKLHFDRQRQTRIYCGWRRFHRAASRIHAVSHVYEQMPTK